MNNLQKLGGFAAIIHAAAYLVGIGLYLSALSPILDASPDQYLAMFADYQNLMYVWIFIAYLVAGLCLVPVSLALNERLQGGPKALVQSSTVFGLIWACLIIGSGNLMLYGFVQLPEIYASNPAQAETVLLALRIVEDGIVSGSEFIGGTWALLVSWVALKTGTLPKLLNIFGFVIGLAGIISIVPTLNEMGSMFFGLSMIPWFVWLGVAMLRSRQDPAHQEAEAFIPQQSMTG